MRIVVTVAALALVAAACSPVGTSTTTSGESVDSTTPGQAPPADLPETTSTTQVSTTSAEASKETVPEPAQVFEYAVVAEKVAGRLAIVDLAPSCSSGESVCDVTPVMTVDLPARPHNIASFGSAVYATHPSSGSLSRVDVATGDLLTEKVGREPHDVKYDAASGEIVVADEAGRKLLKIDPESLEVLGTVDLPGEPHDFIVAGDVIWVTLIGRSELIRVVGDQVEIMAAGGSPHDLIMDGTGSIWYSNWGSKRLNIFDPVTGITPEAPAGVGEPQHFAIGPDGAVWISDIAAGAIVGFTSEEPQIVPVGDSPHHLAFLGDTIVVAVSGSGEAVFVRDGQVVGRSRLTTGLHGVAIVELSTPLP
ncbi:MAG: hypothetical protein BMS9Abin17_0242 [Acidimicrobiia bacterium]|nr:MAG: hypothetical protein BMS9Abin17_0242 [Acidimicrobiia bacterium]